MQIDITKLLTNQITKLTVNDNVLIPEELLKDSRIDKLENVYIDATISIDEDNELIINGIITGTMYLKDDLTLEPVTYKFKADLEENLEKIENILDITDILWQNILVEIPSKVRSTEEEVHLSGNGWRVISEEEFNRERSKQNNPFAELSELLNTKEDK